MNKETAQHLIQECVKSYRRNPTPDTLGECFKKINEYCNFNESMCNSISMQFVNQIS